MRGGEENSDEKNHPLSREGWIMLLSGELNYLKMETLGLATISFACALACLAGIIAFITEKNFRYILVFSVFVSYFIALALIQGLKTIKGVKPIERIREGIILENEGFKTYDEIREQCKNARVILKRKKKKILKEKDMFSEEHHNRGNKKVKGIKRNYLIILALAVFDLIALFILFLTINIIIFLIVLILLLGSQYHIMKQQIGSEKYYRTIVEKEGRHLDNELLTKMFKMRMTNLRHTIFALLGLFLMLTIAIVINTKTLHNCLDSSLYWATLAGAGLFGILILLYGSVRFDRYAIEELDELFKAMKKLDQLKKESDDGSAKSIEESRTKE